MSTSKKNNAGSKAGKVRPSARKENIISARGARFILLGILLITGMIYLRTSSYSFVNWDDDENITGNKNLKLSTENIKYHFENSRYKSLAIWSFMIDNYLFGDKAGRYHLHNVLLHLINILLVFILVLKITKKEIFAVVVSGLFALHPVFTEAVAWAAGRKDLLFFLFSLLSIFSYRHYLQKKQHLLWLLPVLVFVYLASLAKIQAFTLPLVFLCFDWYEKRKFSVILLLEKVMLVALIADKFLISLGVVMLILLFYFYSDRIVNIAKERASKILFWYLIVLLVLISIKLVFVLKPMVPWKFIFLVHLMLLCWTVYMCVRKREPILSKIKSLNSTWQGGFFIAPFIIFFLLFIKIKYLIMNIVMLGYWNSQAGDSFSFSERFFLGAQSLMIYISRFFLISPQNPMIAYPQHTEDGGLPGTLYINAVVVLIAILVLIFLIHKYAKKNRLLILGALWFMASICIVLHFFPIQGRVVAADRYAYPAYIGLFLIIAAGINFLMERYNKKLIWVLISAVFLMLSVNTYSNIGIWKNSKTLWLAAVNADSSNHYALSALSTAYFKEDGDFKNALRYADLSIKLKQDHQYYTNRGKIKYYMYDFKGALSDFQNAIALDSSSFAAYNNRGAVYQQFGYFSKALGDYSKALLLKPDYQEAQDNKKKVIRLMAIDSIVLNASSISAADTAEASLLIRVQSQNYIKGNQYDSAALYLIKGIKLIPANAGFYEQLSYVYQLKKENTLSLDVYKQGLAVLPDNASLLLDRGILYYNNGDTAHAFSDWKKSAILGNQQAQSMISKYRKK